MVANCVARNIQVLIGADSQDWSEAVGDFEPNHESLAVDGLIITQASLVIFDIGPESISPRANPTRWKEGQLVSISIRNDADTAWVAWGQLRILSIAGEPEDGAIELELGCWLAWAGKLDLEGDESGVTLGTAENSAVVAARLLQAAGIPEAAIDLGTSWDFAIDYPLQKEGSGSYVGQAADLAFSNLHRHLVQHPDGIIRAVQWSTTPGTPVAAIEVGVGERGFTASPDPIQPVEQVIVSGVGYQTTSILGRDSSRSTVERPANLYVAGAIGNVNLTTTVVNTRTSGRVRAEVRRTEPRAASWVGSTSLSSTTTIEYQEKVYAGLNGRLTEVVKVKRASNRTLVPPPALEDQIDLMEATAEYTYNQSDVLVKVVETTREPKAVGDGSVNFDMKITEVTTTTWKERRPDKWVQQIDREIAAFKSPSARGNTDPFALISEPTEIVLDSRPPATERQDETTATKETHYTATALWEHPGGATGLTRTQEITLNPAFSNAQCFDIATLEVQLLEGRRLAYTIQLPITDALIWVAPLSTITVDDGSNLWTFKVDAASWLYGVEEASLSVAGICVARVPVEVPVGTPLPEFESGLVPGQVAPEEPEPFVPPTDDVRDVEVAGSARRGVGTVEVVLTDSVAVAGSARRGSGTVDVEVTQSIVASGSAQRGAGAVEIELPIAIETAGSARRGSGAVEVEQPIAVEVAGSARRGSGVVEVNIPSTLLNGLLWWYKFDEASGNAIDAHTGGYTLTQVGTVGTAAGVVGTARSFDGDEGNYLASSNAVFARGDTDFYMACRVYFNSFPGDQNFLGRYTFSTADRSYLVSVNASGILSFIVSGNGTAAAVVSRPSSISAAAWHLVEVYHDAANNLIGIAANGSSWATTAHSTGLFGGTAPFSVGRVNIGFSSFTTALNGRVDELMALDRIPTSAERAEILAATGYPG